MKRFLIVVVLLSALVGKQANSVTFDSICGYINLSSWSASAIGHALLFSPLGGTIWNYAELTTNVTPPPDTIIINNPRTDTWFLPPMNPPAVWHNVNPSPAGTYTVTGVADIWGEYYDDEYDTDFTVFWNDIPSCFAIATVPSG